MRLQSARLAKLLKLELIPALDVFVPRRRGSTWRPRSSATHNRVGINKVRTHSSRGSTGSSPEFASDYGTCAALA